MEASVEGVVTLVGRATNGIMISGGTTSGLMEVEVVEIVGFKSRLRQNKCRRYTQNMIMIANN